MDVVAASQPGTTCARTEARDALWERFASRIQVNPALSRSLVSYQANRNRPCYRWFKYKEGFSAALVEYALSKFGREPGRLLDPFAGSGAALFAGRELGWDCAGIELLPVGVEMIQSRLAADIVNRKKFSHAVNAFLESDWRQNADPGFRFRHLRITKDAYPAETENEIASFQTYVRDAVSDPSTQALFRVACLAVLEAVSYTRKDGQYLRWDERAPRELRGKRFNKGYIPRFRTAIVRQLRMMADDLHSGDLFSRSGGSDAKKIEVLHGSSLELLCNLPERSYDAVVTSPPYCNRYDYTRTYALELAFLGVDEEALKKLRQALLSCTVENREKIQSLARTYESVGAKQLFGRAVRAFENQSALQEVLTLLDEAGKENRLNNTNVPRMVKNYFLESSVVIHELARLVRPGGHVFMVNDNVQYVGEEVPVDIILSDLAEGAGFVTRHIWTLGRGKGNSSQQMGAHGRRELRKCMYVWERR